MITYSEFRPTRFDGHISLDEREDWLVAPVSRNRDTEDPLDISNWESFLREMPTEENDDDEQGDYEIHRFGHWGPGWFEIILIRPGTESSQIAEDIERALSDYPVLNESDWSEKEHEAADECWENWQRSEVESDIRKFLSDRTEDILDNWEIAGLSLADCVDEWFPQWSDRQGQIYSSDGAHNGYFWNTSDYYLSRNDLAEFLKIVRHYAKQAKRGIQ